MAPRRDPRPPYSKGSISDSDRDPGYADQWPDTWLWTATAVLPWVWFGAKRQGQDKDSVAGLARQKDKKASAKVINPGGLEDEPTFFPPPYSSAGP